MDQNTLLGVLLVACAGIFVGGCAWPMKLMKKFQFEHWWFIGMLTGLVILPWGVTLWLCPDALSAYAAVPVGAIITANLWGAGWGIANVLCGLCFVRIGVALTGAILTGLGVSLGVTLPMIVKGSGLFRDAPDPGSPAGLVVLAGVGVMLVGVVFASLAGFGRDQVLKKDQATSGSFAGGLVMVVVAGVLSCGMSLAFVYGQGPIVEAMKARGAGEIPSTFAVWAVCLMSGALINLGYPLYLMAKNKSFGVLLQSVPELLLASVIGLNLGAGIVLMGTGMLWLGALGASVGFGIQQASQMIGGQGLGFLSGEWKGVHGTPRNQMYLAIVILIAAAFVMAFGNTLTKS